MTTIASLVEAAPESLSQLTRAHIKEMRQGIATIDAEYKNEEPMDAEETKRLFQLVEGIARKCTRDAQPKKNNKNKEGEDKEEEAADEKPKDHPMDMKRECIMLCAQFQNSAFVQRSQQNRMLKSIRQLTTKEEDTKKKDKNDSGLKKGEVAVSAQVLKSFQEMQAAVAKINLGGDAGSDKKKKKRKRNRRGPKKEGGEEAAADAAGGDDAEAKNEE